MTKTRQIPASRQARLQEMLGLDLLDTDPEERFDRLTRLATDIFRVPMAIITLMDGDRQWYKSRVGVEISEVESDHSFCQYLVGRHDSLVIEDTLTHEIVADQPQIHSDGDVRFYAGVALYGPTGIPVGSMCIGDATPRKFDTTDLRILTELARLAEQELARINTAGRAAWRAIADTARDPALPVSTRSTVNAELERVLAHAVSADSQLAVFHMHVENLGAHALELESTDQQRLIHRWAVRLGKSCPNMNYFTRLTDTDFIGTFEYTGTNSTAMRCYQHLQADARREITLDGSYFNFEVTSGLSLFPDHGKTVQTLLHNARLAQNAAHKTGGAMLFNDRIEARSQHEKTLKRRFEKALASGDIGFVWQPMFDSAQLQIAGFELLARWHDTDLGWIKPEDFIPVINSRERLRRLMVAHALDSACAQLALWLSQSGPAALNVAINVPGEEFLCADFPDVVASTLTRHGIDGSRVILELSERSVVGDFQAAARAMARVTALGVRIAVDDFGSGYSSIGYLTELPLSAVKIDKSQVQRAVAHNQATGLTRDIVSLAHTQGLITVAEGIETPEQLNLIRNIGCEYVQGYLLGTPLDADAIDTTIAAGRAELAR